MRKPFRQRDVCLPFQACKFCQVGEAFRILLKTVPGRSTVIKPVKVVRNQPLIGTADTLLLNHFDALNTMKSNVFAALTIGAAAVFSQPAFAMDGTINFTGSVTSNTCTIDGNGTGSNNFNVLMPTVSVDSLTAQGQTAGNTPFTIRLTACTPDSGTVHTFFEPAANGNAATGNLTIAAGGASNVEVRLLNGDESPINVTLADGAQNSNAVSVTDGEATLRYLAQYYAVGQAGAGTVGATAKYTIIYQ